MPKQKSDAAHRYFEYDVASNISTCQLCNNKLKGKHATNLKNHLAAKHLAEYAIISNINQDMAQTQTSTSNSGGVKPANLEKLKHLCVRLVTVHGRPLAMIEDAAFQELINTASSKEDASKYVNIKEIKNCIQNEAAEIKKKICKEIKNQLISLKLDAATCQERKFIGVNIQYIKDEKIIVRNLAVLEVYDRQTAGFLKDTLEEILSEFQISMHQIYCICTDNGSNMVKMVKILGGKYCSDNEEVAANASDHEDTEDEDADLVNIENDRGSNEINDIFMDFDIENFTFHDTFKVRGMLCAAHTLQLAVKDAVNSDVVTQTSINMARKIVNILRKPNNANLLKRNSLKKPIRDCPTRWSSMFNMLERLLTLQEFSVTVPEITSLVSDVFWCEIKDIVTSLQPANEATLILQKNQLTIGDFFIAWLNCKNKVNAIQHNFALALHQAMEQREVKLMENDVVLEGLYLDGRINIILSPQQCQKARSLLNEVHQQIRRINESNLPELEHITEETAPRPSTSTDFSALEAMLVNTERVRGLCRERRSFEHCLLEVLTTPRLNLSENIIMYWQNKTVATSQLAMVAKVVLSAPATQVSVERLFSSLKFILHPLRSNLKSTLLQDLMIIRENKDLL